MKNCKINCNGKEYEAQAGICLGSFLRIQGFESLVCGGHGKCGKCRVLCSGELSDLTETEKRILSDDDIKSGVRLACQTYIKGDCTVKTETGGKAVIKTDGVMPDLVLDPVFGKYGAAVDIGTTTVALSLYDKNGALLSSQSALNPQRRYGADVVSRMEAALKGEADGLTAAIRECISSLLSSAADDAGIKANDIDSVVVTGNTVMLHFLTGTDTEPLTHAPFEVKRLFGEILTAKELDFSVLNDGTPVYIPRCAAAFIGADTVTAIVSSGIYKSGMTAVLTDIGTNGETVLVHGGKLTACSTAAGPAFEGAGISMGMGGSAGAVDKVYLDENGDIKAHVIGGGKPAGICGSGIVDAVAALVKSGEIDETGYMEDDPAVIAEPVVVTQKDIRAVQLAKSAIHAGIKTLLDISNLSCGDVETLYIAGGFGSYLDVSSAAYIGLIPSELEECVKVLGNAALSGSSAILLSKPLFDVSADIAKSVKVAELASNPVFAAEYMDRMYF